MNTFTVTTENFSGPIDTLLHMIEKRKMPINDVSLAGITDDYIHFIQDLNEDSLANKTHFIFIAATLTLIKSKSLLPKLDLTDEEEGDIDELKRRIALLQEFQNASLGIKSTFALTPNFYYPKTLKKKVSFQPHTSLNTQNLQECLSSVFHEVPEKIETKKEGYVKIAIHIEEMMLSLEERIKHAMATDFNSFIGSHTVNTHESREVKVYKVVGFLAMLELVKNGVLSVLQKNNFSNIEIGQI